MDVLWDTKTIGNGRWMMGINQRISLRKFVDDIRRWLDEGRSDE